MTAAKPVTLGRAAEAFLADNGPLGTESTKRTYGAALSQMRKRFGDDTPLADLTPQDVAGWLQEQWGSQSSGTFNVRLRAVRSAAAWWAEQGWIPAKLTEKVKPRKERAELEVVVFTPDELKALMAAAIGVTAPSEQSPTGIRNKALIMFMYRSGLRIGEALAMKPGDINQEDRSIRVQRTKAGEAQVRFWHPSADAALQQWLERRRALGFNGRQPVFCTISTGPRTKPGSEMSQDYIRKMLRECAKDAGIDKRVHPHELRHTYAVELVRSGADLETIRRLLGHKTLAHTARYLAAIANAEAGEVLSSLQMPDVGEGESAGERDVMAELDELKRQLAEMRKCKGETQ